MPFCASQALATALRVFPLILGMRQMLEKCGQNLRHRPGVRGGSAADPSAPQRRSEDRRGDLPTLLRCHVAAFEALGGVPEQILYDRMKTAVLGEVDERGIVYNDKLLALAAHYGFMPKACRPYRAKTTDEIEQPYSDLDAILPLLTGDRVAQSGTWRCKPRRAAYDSRASFAAPVGTRLPRLVQPSVRRR